MEREPKMNVLWIVDDLPDTQHPGVSIGPDISRSLMVPDR